MAGYLDFRLAVLNRKHNWIEKNSKKKSVSIYVFRHGHTSFNEQHKFCGWRDSKLTNNGKLDAKKIAKQLNGKEIDVAFHSSLSRSIDTLNIALSSHKDFEKVLDDRLIERSYGDLEGHTHAWFVKNSGKKEFEDYVHWHKAHYLDYNKTKMLIEKFGEADLQKVRRGYSVNPPSGESIKDVKKRVDEFIKDLIFICKKYKVDVALSIHGNSMRPIRKYFESLTISEMMHLENPWDHVFEYKIKV